MRNRFRRRIFQNTFGFGRGMGRGRGMRNGTGPRAQMGLCPFYSNDNLKDYKEYLENELELVNTNLKTKKA